MGRINVKSVKALTLMELLIAMVLFGIIIVGFFSFETFGRHHVIASEKRTKLQNNVAFVLEHMTKNMNQAIGDLNNPPVVFYGDNRGFRVRIDSNPANGRVDAGDPWIAYRHENIGATDAEIRFYPNAGTGGAPAGTPERLANKILRGAAATAGSKVITVGGMTVRANMNPAFGLLDNYIEVELVGIWFPDTAVSIDNPEVRMKTRIQMLSVSTH